MASALTSAIGPALTSAFGSGAAPPPSGPTYDPTRSLDFNGVDQHAEAGMLFSSWVPTAITVGGWIMPRATTTQMFFGPDDIGLGVNGTINMRVQSGGTIRFTVRGATNYTEKRSSRTVPIGTWVHVVATWAAGAYPTIYFDGAADLGATNAGATAIGAFDGTHNFLLGAASNGLSLSRFGGSMHLFRVAHVALTAGQVAEWYATTAPAADSVPGVHAWLTSTADTSPGTLYDLIGNADLTPVNSPSIVTDAP